jgi:hypothetical protein
LAAGVKVTLILQLAAGASIFPFAHVVPDASAKSPLMATENRISDVVPVLVSVTVWAVLEVSAF